MIVADYQSQRVAVNVYGEFTLADYKEFEEIIRYRIHFDKPLDLCFDLSEMAEVTLDVAWEDLRFSLAHSQDFRRIAIVTESQWVTWSAWITQVFMRAEVEVFETQKAALEWLDSAV